VPAAAADRGKSPLLTRPLAISTHEQRAIRRGRETVKEGKRFVWPVRPGRSSLVVPLASRFQRIIKDNPRIKKTTLPL
jgi:hypothetical protein